MPIILIMQTYKAALLFSPHWYDNNKMARQTILAADARSAATLFNATGRRSRSLADCQIAAVALRCGARVATGNLSEFTPFQIHGLILA